jgi:AcrR family transcriptional regulator
MSPTQAKAGARSTSNEEATRARILDAALRCFAQIGIAKTSLQDVARVAEMSRGTVYRHFEDRKALIDAAVARGSQQYWADATSALGRKASLAEQAGALAEVVARTQAVQHTRDRLVNGDTGLMRMLLEDARETLAHTMAFLRPYVEEARERGEIRTDVEVDEASEWLARMIMSIISAPASPSFDVNRPRTVGRFVARHAVAGLMANDTD